MKAFVITIQGHQGSESMADRCIQSGARYGVHISKLNGVTPSDDIYGICQVHGIDPTAFISEYSKTDNCIAAFLSHFSLWITCLNINEPVAIFEHDAVLNSPLPPSLPTYVGSIGKPSYGSYDTPSILGWGPLVSKTYFPGAHAYIVTPLGAARLIQAAKQCAAPTDLFLSLANFPWLQEFYPWVAEADDSFSTIQQSLGCLAKHNYSKSYGVVDV